MWAGGVIWKIKKIKRQIFFIFYTHYPKIHLISPIQEKNLIIHPWYSFYCKNVRRIMSKNAGLIKMFTFLRHVEILLPSKELLLHMFHSHQLSFLEAPSLHHILQIFNITEYSILLSFLGAPSLHHILQIFNITEYCILPSFLGAPSLHHILQIFKNTEYFNLLF